MKAGQCTASCDPSYFGPGCVQYILLERGEEKTVRSLGLVI
jgi:hypothetical protein